MKKIIKEKGCCISKTLLMILVIIFLINDVSYSDSIINEWDKVKAPKIPELKNVSLNPKNTALLLLDFNKQTCNAERRPRCIASIPAVKKFYTNARSGGMYIVYSLSPGAAVSDIAPELAPKDTDPVVTSGPDKFLGTELEKILKDKNIETVIIAGTAAHGAVLHTASSAALRGFNVILPVEGLSAEDTYPEQYTVWHLLNAPRISAKVTVTSFSKILIENK